MSKVQAEQILEQLKKISDPIPKKNRYDIEEMLKKRNESINKQLLKNKEEFRNKFDKTLRVCVDKFSQEGWTIPSNLTMYAINTIGNTEDIEDIDEFLKWYFSDDNYRMLLDMVNNCLESNIKKGLKKVITECWDIFQMKSYALCSIGLTSVIEGILSEFSEDKKKYKNDESVSKTS